MKISNKSNSIKAVLFDIDGLVVVGKELLFSQRLSKEYDIPMNDIDQFFDNEFRECSFGRADLKEVIVPYLKKWNWQGTADDLLEYWFEVESSLDQELLSIIRNLREAGVMCYVATRQEKYRMDYMWNTLNFKEYFDGKFCTCDIGHDKCEPEFFDNVLDTLDVKSEQVVFFDDRQKNIDNAKSLGLHAYFYEGIETIKSILQ